MSELNARKHLLDIIACDDGDADGGNLVDINASEFKSLRDLDALLADFVKCANKSKPRLFQAEYDLLVRAKLLGYSNDA